MILLPKVLHKTLINHATKAYPIEACGILVGVQKDSNKAIITNVIESANIEKKDPHHRFEIDPQVHFNTLHELRRSQKSNVNKEKIIGLFHSHPDASAKPSSVDISLAFEPYLIWIIISVFERQVRDTGAFIFDPGVKTFDKIPLKTTCGKHPNVSI